jgi:LuxR family maltose regulon positive regulatory protein
MRFRCNPHKDVVLVSLCPANSMQLPIVLRKLERPVPPPRVIPRTRLYNVLQRWHGYRCIYVHGLAGCGKSVLVSSWLDHHPPESLPKPNQASWLSLDLADQDPSNWVWYLAVAMDRLQPGLLDEISPLLQDEGAGPERCLSYLLASLRPDGDGPSLLVLEDYHRAACPEVDRLLSTLLERGPAWLHVVVISRRATTAPLGRLLAAGQVLEIDDASLRFRRDEMIAYLDSQGFADLPDHLVDLLMERTQGWIAALQLAGLGMLQQPDTADILARLRGDQGWLAEYLTGEVLAHQGPVRKRFLLESSILDRFNVSLIKAVTKNHDAYRLLHEARAANLFLIPLDRSEEWFRYHHLFQELLQHRLHTDLAPERIGTLHRRAAAWLAEANEIDDALNHLLAIPDVEAAVELVAAHLRSAVVRGDSHQAERWIARLPEEAVSAHLSLLIDLALLYALRDDPGMVDYVLQAENVLAATDSATERDRAELLVLTAIGHFLHGDFAAMREPARQAYQRIEHLGDYMVGNLYFVLMHYAANGGNLKDALAHGTQAADAYMRADFTAGVISVRRETAALAMSAGHSQVATRQFEKLAHQRLDERPFALRELGLTHIRAARHYYWLNRLHQAVHHQQAALAMMQRLHDPGFIAEAQCMGQLLHATNPALVPSAEAFDSHDLAVHAKQHITPYLYWDRLLMKRGESAEASMRTADWASQAQSGMPIHDLVRRVAVLHALTVGGHDLTSVTPGYEQALDEAGGEGLQFYRLFLLSLFAWHQLRLGNRKAAAVQLDEALELTEGSGYIRSILDLPELAPLLAKANHPAAPGLLQQMEQESRYSGLERLTAQELTVLQLMDRGYTYREIADELVITMNTVRFHVRNVYAKMGVNRRMDAVRLAKRRGLIIADGK